MLQALTVRAELLRLRSAELVSDAIGSLMDLVMTKDQKKPKRRARSEAEIAAVVVAWLEEQQADVYQEVQTRGGRADIAARVGSEIWSFETKGNLGLDVLAQAKAWCGRAHRSWVAIEKQTWTTAKYELIHEMFVHFGVGLLQIKFPKPPTYVPEHLRVHYTPTVTVLIQPRPFRRLVPDHLGTFMRPEQKILAKAGSARGGHLTPFRSTMLRVRQIVEKHPEGISLADIARELGSHHHYSRDAHLKPGLLQALRKGLVEGCVARRERGRLVLYPVTGGGDGSTG